MQTLDSLQSGQLSGSTRLKLSENLQTFPQEIFTLAETLEVLDLSNNQLSELPENFGDLKQLKILFLSQNNFVELPAVLADCPSLSMIGFKSNQIARVPEDSLPESVRWLILTDNAIPSLPDSMGKLTNLQKVMLAGNQLTALPSSMANCTNLELLRISANRLEALPAWLLSLPKLSWLAFSGNPFLNHEPTDVPVYSAQDFDVHELLGQGASGLIHRATFKSGLSNGNNVALKLFKGEVTSDGYPQDELHASIHSGSHPNLVKVQSRFEDGKQTGVVLDLICKSFDNLGLPPSFDTCTRDTFDSELTLSFGDIEKIIYQVADTMMHLHQRNMCHGDLYCHNLLFNQQKDILLTDFGAASLYAALSDEERKNLQAIEVRAFGCLMDDLLSLNGAIKDESEYLMQLRDRCLDTNTAQRPTFSTLVYELDNAISRQTIEITNIAISR